MAPLRPSSGGIRRIQGCCACIVASGLALLAVVAWSTTLPTSPAGTVVQRAVSSTAMPTRLASVEPRSVARARTKLQALSKRRVHANPVTTSPRESSSDTSAVRVVVARAQLTQRNSLVRQHVQAVIQNADPQTQVSSTPGSETASEPVANNSEATEPVASLDPVQSGPVGSGDQLADATPPVAPEPAVREPDPTAAAAVAPPDPAVAPVATTPPPVAVVAAEPPPQPAVVPPPVEPATADPVTPPPDPAPEPVAEVVAPPPDPTAVVEEPPPDDPAGDGLELLSPEELQAMLDAFLAEQD